MEGFSELDPVSVAVTNTGIEEFSVMHVAAAKGHQDIIELLLQNNISLLDFGKGYPSPLHLAAANGHLEVVRLFYDYNETFDLISLHHAAAKNHFAVVHFLLSTVGLRDNCVPCHPEHFSEMSQKKTIQESHAFFCETALHAAVSRGLIDIVQQLLNFGKESLECKHYSGKTVLMDAVERNDTEMVDFLIKCGANITADCGHKMSRDSVNHMCSFYSMHKKDFLYTVYCAKDSCGCGYTAIHISAKYGLWNMAEILLSGRTEEVVDVENCDNESATHVAIMYDHLDFVTNVSMSLEKVGRYLNESKIARLAIGYCSANVANSFLHNIIDEDEEMWNILRIYHIIWSPYRELDVVFTSFANCFKGIEDENISDEKKTEKKIKKHLNTIKLLIEKHQWKSSILHTKDLENKTLLHYAALGGFDDAVKYLVEHGANVYSKDKNGDTPLMNALKISQVNDQSPSSSYRCYTTSDGQFGSCKTTCYDETVRYLIQSQKATISKCDGESALMLKLVIQNRMPLSLYALLKIGVAWNCPLTDDTSAMLLHLHVGGREVTEVIKMFEVDVSVKCGVSFSNSELHQLSYFSVPEEFGNFFKPSLNKKHFLLQRLIDNHPRGVRILDECYDAEGYLPIHRAAQGGNLAAIKWFKSVGVNTQLKTRTGLTALDISILYLDVNNGELDAPSKILLYVKQSYLPVSLQLTSKYRENVFNELLQTFSSTMPKLKVLCGPTLKGLSLLHIAAVKGMAVLKYVHQKASNIFPSLPINCLNRHQLDPVYLAKFYDSVRNAGIIYEHFEERFDDDLQNLKDKIINYGKRKDKNKVNLKCDYDNVSVSKYPNREVEYLMVLNYLYLPPLSQLTEKNPFFSTISINHCPGYYDVFRKFNNEKSSPALPDETRCSKIRLDSDKLLCQRELLHDQVTYNCHLELKLLQLQYTTRRRTNRQLSQFILKRLGWSDGSQVKDIDERWPFYFLHKKHLKDYKPYEYLEVLNEALEVADVRFYSRLFDDMLRMKKIIVDILPPHD